MNFVCATYFADTNNYFRNDIRSFPETLGNNVRSNLNYCYWKSWFCFSLLLYQYPWQPAIYLVWTAPPENIELFCVLWYFCISSLCIGVIFHVNSTWWHWRRQDCLEISPEVEYNSKKWERLTFLFHYWNRQMWTHFPSWCNNLSSKPTLKHS